MKKYEKRSDFSKSPSGLKAPHRDKNKTNKPKANAQKPAKNKQAPAIKGKTFSGQIRMSKTGNGFIDLPNGDSIIIPRGYTGSAIDRDTVKIKILPPRINKTGSAGEVIEIIKRGTDSVAGVIDCINGLYFLKPIKKSYPFLVSLEEDELQGGVCGTAALAQITSWDTGLVTGNANIPGNVTGKIIKTFGKRGDHETDMALILSESLENPNFEKALMDAVHALPPVDVEKELQGGRRDFCDDPTCTIDPERAQDFDDALSIKEIEGGDYEIGIHIADVSYYVTPGNAIDVEAYRRGTSIYLVDRCIPMLPERLSNDLCSLKEGVPRLTMSTVVIMGRDGSIKDTWIGPGIINSKKRFTYEQVDEILNNKGGLLYKELRTLMDLAEILEKSRIARGALVFNRDEVRFVLDDTGRPINIIREKSSPSHMLVESFMLLANTATANKIASRNGGLGRTEGMYRVHGEPNETAVMELILFVKSLGIKTPATLKKPVEIFKHILKSVKDLPIAPIIDDMIIRSQAKAHYSEINSGHFGLALKSYCHFTSPIRRYPDLVAHRIIRSMINNTKFNYNKNELHITAEHDSEREERATEAERASIRYKQIEFLEKSVGTNRKGIIVAMTDNIRKVIDNETSAMVICLPNNVRINLGDTIEYTLMSADRLQDILTGDIKNKVEK